MLGQILSINWDVDPVFFSLGSIDIRYYGLSWALGLAISWWLFSGFINREGYKSSLFDSIFWYAILSTIIGARLGHCLFYDPVYYLQHPWEILYLREGGVASHGAAIGLLLGMWLFSRKNKMPYMWSMDRIMIVVAISGATIRLGNLMNSEIYGHETSLPWGFIFVRAGEILPKHPTQIYEALCYFLTFGVLAWLYYKKDVARRRPGLLFGLGVFMIFASRFIIEFIKNPQEEFERGMMLDMGQILSIPFIILSIYMMIYALRRPEVKVQPFNKNMHDLKATKPKNVPKSKKL